MDTILSQINELQRNLSFLKDEFFQRATSGTHHKVFISKNYVIRLRQDNPKLLTREMRLLEQMNHSLIPKIVWSGAIAKSFMMVENRLPGKTLNATWKDITDANKLHIIQQLIQFLQYLRGQQRQSIYSVNTGKEYSTFLDFLMDGFEKKIRVLKKIRQTHEILHSLQVALNISGAKSLFLDTKKTLVHGDLINHNLLTDGSNLTGILDWELALYGDPDYDLSRLFYYQECARAYQEQETDDSYEAEYMDKLIASISKSDLIRSKELFQQKHNFIRAILYLNALYWAANSEASERNIDELIVLWNKNMGPSL